MTKAIEVSMVPKFGDISAWKGLLGWNQSPIRSPEILLILSPVSGDEKKRRNDKLIHEASFFFAWRVFKRSNTKPFEAIAGNLKVRPLEPDPQIETKGPDKA